jgi:hypothetical protein
MLNDMYWAPRFSRSNYVLKLEGNEEYFLEKNKNQKNSCLHWWLWTLMKGIEWRFFYKNDCIFFLKNWNLWQIGIEEENSKIDWEIGENKTKKKLKRLLTWFNNLFHQIDGKVFVPF